MPLSQSDHQRNAANARARKLSPKRRSEIAAKGGAAGKGKKKPRKQLPEDRQAANHSTMH